VSETDSPALDRPTIIVVHIKENPKKCTVESLRGEGRFRFIDFDPSAPVEESNRSIPKAGDYLRLDVDGRPLTYDDGPFGLLLFDATWRLASKMATRFPKYQTRSLPRLTSAYPRVSKMTADPSEGLATIEALYVAHLITGRPVNGLLDQYRWKSRFLETNGEALDQLARVANVSLSKSER
jgi:pre-rRNA-processing protein TSR3